MSHFKQYLQDRGLRNVLISIVAVVFILFQCYLAFVKPLHALLQCPIHWGLLLIIAYLCNPFYKRPEGAAKSWKDYLNIIDIFCFAGLIYDLWYFISQYSRLISRIAYISPLMLIDYIAMVISIALILEITRRVLGWNLLIFLLLCLAYIIFGKNLPGILGHPGTTISKFTDLMVMGTQGIFGTTVSFSVNYMVYFIFFGALFAACGGGQTLIDIGFKVSREGSYGGPAKAAVVASGLFGMASGSATANVSTTGVITIPMMKDCGYEGHEAGAIESLASTGGQMVPPVMGASAFLMAELIGVSYLTICVAAVVPALCYYFAVFMLVTLMAKRNAERGSKLNDSRIETKPVLPRMYLLLPMMLLVYFVCTGSSLRRAALTGIFSVLIINILRWKKGVPPKEIFALFIDAAKSTANIIIPTSACGIIIGVVTSSGLATRLSNAIAGSGSNIAVALILCMIGCMILGMALPTLAAYLTANVLFASTLIKLGLSPLQTNMFMFYFGVFAQITPPVCTASFAAAGIAKANPWKTGWTAFKYAAVCFLVPYVFVFKGEMFMGQGYSLVASAITITTLLLGIIVYASGLSGYLFTHMNKVERSIMVICGFGIILPIDSLSIICAAIAVAIAVINVIQLKKAKAIAKA